MVFQRVSRLASIPFGLIFLIMALVWVQPARATGLLRDAGIEQSLTQLAAPVLRAAGLSPERVRILVVDDSSLNAFVLDHNAIYLHYGLILKMETPAQLQAVIAHEAAHITNGHLARRLANMQSARNAAGLGMALAAIAAAAGADSSAAAGIAIGSQTSALRNFLAHTRAEEAAADQTAARVLLSAGVSPIGLLEVHRMFRGQEALNVSRQDPYMQSHPLTRDRVRAAEAFVAGMKDAPPERLADEYWHARARGKLSAFIRSPSWTRSRLKEEKFKDVRLMREAIMWHRQSDTTRALKAIEGVLAIRPRDAFYWDLKAEILMKGLRTSAAVSAYQMAAKLAPTEAMILGGLGRALLAADRPKEALGPLEDSRRRDFRDARVLRDMSIAYARTNKIGLASVVTAERYALQGRLDDAGIHAKRAIGLLPRGSAAWRRAEDVLIASERNAKRRK